MELGTALIDVDREMYAKLIIKLGLWVVRKWVSSAKSRANGLKIVGLIVCCISFPWQLFWISIKWNWNVNVEKVFLIAIFSTNLSLVLVIVNVHYGTK